MNTFFTAELSQHNVRAAWRERKATLRAEQLQDFNDLLYMVVSSRILARRQDIYNSLIHAINTSPDGRGASIPLWEYHTAHYKEFQRDRPDACEEALRRKGYHWLVGTVEHGFTPRPHMCANETEEDGYVGFWDHIWGWGRMPRSVHEVVRSTDFRNRIALLFGDDQYRVSWVAVARKYLTKPEEISIEKVELRLHYHPRGLYDRVRREILDTKRKYERHVSYVPEAWRMPYVWTGVPDHRETTEEESVRQVTPEPPGFSNRTPPQPASPISEPPPLARRTNGGGLKPEDSPNPARRLSFEDTPRSGPEYPDGSQLGGAERLLSLARRRIQTYEGEDAVERCARDAVAEWAAEACCHCEYHP